MGHSPLSIESVNDIMRMTYKDRGSGSFNLFEDHTVEGSHSRRKINESKKCNSMISLSTKLTVQPLLLKKICAGRFVSALHLKYPFPRSRLIDSYRYCLEPGH